MFNGMLEAIESQKRARLGWKYYLPHIFWLALLGVVIYLMTFWAYHTLM